MVELLKNRWVQLVLGVAVAFAFAIGVAVSPSLLPSAPAPISVGDRAMLTSGDASQTIVDGRRLGSMDEIFEDELPLTAAGAVAAGWKDPVLCAPGRGRYFSRQQGGVADPYLLLYDNANELTGIYLFSDTEMPAPWKHMDELLGGGTHVIDHEHWGMYVYFKDPTRACTPLR